MADQLRSIFMETLPCKMKAKCDMTTIEAILYTMEEERFKADLRKPYFPDIFAHAVITEFNKYKMMCDLSGPI